MSVSKDTNPKDAVGTKKVPFSCIPSAPIAELGLAMLEGARKYGRHNYRVAGVRASVYYDAALRHLTAWYEGEDIDPDSGLSHLIKAMACLTVVRDSELRGNWIDDRPPSMPTGWQVPLNKKAAAIIDKLPDAKDAYVKETIDLVTEGPWNSQLNYKGGDTNLGVGSYEVEITPTGTTWRIENPDLWEKYLEWCQKQPLQKRYPEAPEPALPLDDVVPVQPTFVPH